MMFVICRPMKQAIIICLIISLLGESFSRCFIFLNYIVHKEYITKYLCENRNNPQMHCNGKCYLRKNLHKEDTKDPQRTARKNVQKVQILSSLRSNHAPAPPENSSITLYHFFQENITSSFLYGVFHPPQYS